MPSQTTGRHLLHAPDDADRPPYRRCLTGERWKYYSISLRDGREREQLYDLKADPYELRDVSAEHEAVLTEMREELQRQQAQQQARAVQLRGGLEPQTQAADAETMEQLEALGYLDP